MSEATDTVKVSQVKCKMSASLQPNNLIYNGKYYAYVHRNEVQLVDHKPNLFEVEKAEKVLKAAYADKDPVSSIEFAALTFGRALIVSTTVGMIVICDETGEKLIHSHKLQKSQVALSAKDAYLRCSANDGKESLFFGSGSGDVLLFQVTASKLALTKKIPTTFSRALWCMGYQSESGILAVGDEGGNVSVFTVAPGSDDVKRSWEWKGSGSPMTSLVIGHGCIVTADVTGRIRVFGIEKKGLGVEICAHARNITAIDLHPTKPMVVAVSEDTFVSVWSLPTASQPVVRNLLMHSPAPALLTGVKFAGKNAQQIVTTVYDSKSLFSIPTPNL